MNQKEFYKHVAETTGKTQKEVKEMAQLFEDCVSEVITSGESVKLIGLTLSVKDTAPRKSRNPKTGEVIDVPAKKRVAVKVSPALKRTVNE